MELKLFTDSDLAYSNKAVFKSVDRDPAATLTLKRFNYGDMINTTVTIGARDDIDVSQVTYCILDNSKHYFITSVEWVSGEKKYNLGLLRNVWPDITDDTNIIGTIQRGTATGIERYKPNSIQLSEQKAGEYFIKDSFMKESAGIISSGGLWGILYCANVDENPQITINASQYTITGSSKLEDRYYTRLYRGTQPSQQVTNQVFIGCESDDLSLIKGYWCTASTNITTFYSGGSTYLSATVSNINTDYSYVSFIGSYLELQLTQRNAFFINIGKSDESGVRNFISNPTTQFAKCSDSVASYNSAIIESFNTPTYPDTLSDGTYTWNYISEDEFTSREGTVVNVENTLYKTELEYTSIGYNETSLITIQAPDQTISTSEGLQFPSGFTFNSNITYQTRTVTQAKYNYITIEDAGSLEIDAEISNQSVVLMEPYGIIALPLFDITDTNGNTYLGLDTQEFFYSAISQFSGGTSPFVVDAQIIPYAPNDFVVAQDSNGRVDMDLLKNATKEQVSYNGFPPTMILTSADITVNATMNLEPFTDIQKEYTINKYRIKDPGQINGFDFSYYDYATDNESITLQVDITLKPFGTYMHCAPIIQQGAMAAIKDFDDIRGVVSDKTILECTTTSNAFETYKRENTMYENVQERTIQTLKIEHKTESVNEGVSATLGILQSTAMGALTGSSIGGNIGAGVMSGIAGVASAGMYLAQNIANSKLRDREVEDANFYYDANLKTIQALPDTISRVSEFNQDVLKKFCFFIEKYSAPIEQQAVYDVFVEQVGDNIEIPGNIKDYLTNGKYIQASILKTNACIYIAEQIKNDLKRGIYYYDKI